MQNRSFILLICLIMIPLLSFPEEDFLKIDTIVSPASIPQGEGGLLKLKITPRSDIKISSHLRFMIKLDDNANLSFSKIFFTASELDLASKQENDTVFLELEKEISIPFKVNENSLIGKHKIHGEVIYTAVFKDNWSLKTYKKFDADFISQRSRKVSKK